MEPQNKRNLLVISFDNEMHFKQAFDHNNQGELIGPVWLTASEQQL